MSSPLDPVILFSVLGLLAGGASDIAARRACQVAIPKANPTLYLTAASGIPFPFNRTVGIPVYFALTQTFHGLLKTTSQTTGRLNGTNGARSRATGFQRRSSGGAAGEDAVASRKRA